MRPLEDDEPTVVGPYRLLGRLGSGGMGRVYLGRSAGGRTVAVKIVHPHFALDEEFRARFRREVAAARRVGGAWTAPVLDADPEARVPWVATAYAAGPSLTAAVADGGPLPAHSVRALGAGLGEALAAVHELGLVHRDVKPSNVLLTLDGPLLIDFGIARATGGTSPTQSGGGTASLTSTGVSIGSPGYMSPEQILGKGVTGAADVFSLGAVLAYATTGQPPFPGDSSAALLYKVVHEEPNLDGLDDGELRELVASCLAKDPSARPPPVMPAPTSPSYPPSPPAPAPAPSPALLSVPGPRHPGPPDDDPGAGTGTTRPPGRLALSVAATSTQGAQGRGRRISCTVALAVAGALAAVTVGSVFVLDLLPGSGNDANNAGGNEASHDPPAATPGGLPARYLGTWEGQAAALDGKLPLGTFRITIKQAKAGQELGRLRQTDALGGVCVDVITLKKVTEKQLVAGSAGAEGNHDGCNPAPTTVTFTPVGDDLDYASKSEESGRPTARLSKVG